MKEFKRKPLTVLAARWLGKEDDPDILELLKHSKEPQAPIHTIMHFGEWLVLFPKKGLRRMTGDQFTENFAIVKHEKTNSNSTPTDLRD